MKPAVQPALTNSAILAMLDSLASGDVRAGMERFGIKTANAKGIDTPTLKALAKKIGKSHALAAELWASGGFEARAIAALIDEPAKVTPAQMEAWANDFDNWATVDGCCCYLFCRTSFAWAKAKAWSRKKPEFHKRAAFSLMAYLAVHAKQADDECFIEFLPLIERESDDDRNFVRKAVNWALRQIGKRNMTLNRLAIATAERIRERGTKAAWWIAADALRELKNPKTVARIRGKKGH